MSAPLAPLPEELGGLPPASDATQWRYLSLISSAGEELARLSAILIGASMIADRETIRHALNEVDAVHLGAVMAFKELRPPAEGGAS